MGSHAFHSHNPHSAMRGIFFPALSKECNIKEGFERRMTLSIVGRCFLILRVEPAGWLNLKRSSAKLEHGAFRYYYEWPAWRSTELASHLVPPQLPVY